VGLGFGGEEAGFGAVGGRESVGGWRVDGHGRLDEAEAVSAVGTGGVKVGIEGRYDWVLLVEGR